MGYLSWELKSQLQRTMHSFNCPQMLVWNRPRRAKACKQRAAAVDVSLQKHCNEVPILMIFFGWSLFMKQDNHHSKKNMFIWALFFLSLSMVSKGFRPWQISPNLAHHKGVSAPNLPWLHGWDPLRFCNPHSNINNGLPRCEMLVGL